MSRSVPPVLLVRHVALQRLLRVMDEGAYVSRLATETESAETARGALDIVAGVTRHRRWLDFLLSHVYRGDIEALDPPLRQILRIGAYELAVQGIPPHAAVNEAVALARSELHRGAAGLTNAVLRNLSRRLDDLPEPVTGDDAEDLAIRHSHPMWMVRRWLARWGSEATVRLLVHDNRVPRYALRTTGGAEALGPLLQLLDSLGVTATRSEWLDDFFTVDRLQPVFRAGLLKEGTVAVQDEAAGLVVRVLDPQPGERLLDAAAAPGGKAIYAALRTGGKAAITALDISEAKVRLIEQAAAAQGALGMTTVAADFRSWPVGEPFDAVLLDAPCSGTGVLAKRADLRWRRDEAALAELTALQDELLDAAAGHLRMGGRLVYSTCSLEPEENEDRVAAFLSRHAGWTRRPVAHVPEPFVTLDGFYAALPHVHGTDGAFAAVLVAP